MFNVFNENKGIELFNNSINIIDFKYLIPLNVWNRMG